MKPRNQIRTPRIGELAFAVFSCGVLAAPAAQAMSSQGLGNSDFGNVSVPTFAVKSNGVEPTVLDKSLSNKWSGRLTTEEFPVVRIKSFKFGPSLVVPAKPELGFSVAKKQPYDENQDARKSYKYLQKQIDENISGNISLANMENFAWSACKTHVDYLRVVKKMSRKEIFSVDRKIPLHWGFSGHMRTTHITPSPTEVQEPALNPKAVSYIICKKFEGPAIDHAGDMAADLGPMGLYQMNTLPTRSLGNLYEKCPAPVSLATIVYSNQKGVLKAQVEYRDEYGKITKGPKRNVHTGKPNPNDGKVITEFMTDISLPVAKRVPPGNPTSGGSIGGLAAEQRKPDDVLPGNNNKNIHRGAVRVVIKTGQPVKVSPGGQQAESELKGALASDWILYTLTCKPQLNPALGGMPNEISGGKRPTHSKGSPADLVATPSKAGLKGENPGRRPGFKKQKRTYVDIAIKDAKMVAPRRLSVTAANAGTAGAQGCSLNVAYQTGNKNRQTNLVLGNIAAGANVTKATRLAGFKPPKNIKIKASCSNEPPGRRRNNNRTLN